MTGERHAKSRAGVRAPGANLAHRGIRAGIVGLLLLLTPAAPRGLVAQELFEGFELGGGIYLFHFAPIDLEGADANTEVYALFLNVDRSEGPFELHIQGRWRDTKLRPFFPSNVWIQEGWVGYTQDLSDQLTEGARVSVRAGKFYQRIGRFWDGSFFGNIQYFDGLKLDPEFGAEVEASAPIGKVELTAYGQLLLQGDRVNGSLAGRDVEGFDGAQEENGFAVGARTAILVAEPGGRPLTVTLGVSGLSERAELAGGPRALLVGSDRGQGIVPVPRDADPDEIDVDLDHLTVDGELGWGDVLGYVEWTRRSTSGFGAAATSLPGSRADYWLVGAQAAFGPVALRYNYSRSDYDDAGFSEEIHQPGVTLSPVDWAHLILEYDDWTRDGPPALEARIDRSVEIVLLVEF